MRVLFDHNLPHKLRISLLSAATFEIEIVTASHMGWSHLKNGELLRAAEDSDFDVLVTGDRTLVHEQNLSGRRLSILALSANNWPIVKNFIAQILGAVCSAVPAAFVKLDCGEFSRKKPAGKP